LFQVVLQDRQLLGDALVLTRQAGQDGREVQEDRQHEEDRYGEERGGRVGHHADERGELVEQRAGQEQEQQDDARRQPEQRIVLAQLLAAHQFQNEDQRAQRRE